jgi:hypothetical protein
MYEAVMRRRYFLLCLVTCFSRLASPLTHSYFRVAPLEPVCSPLDSQARARRMYKHGSSWVAETYITQLSGVREGVLGSRSCRI